MTRPIQQLTRDISKIDLQDVCSWQWLLKGQNEIILISDVGDLLTEAASVPVVSPLAIIISLQLKETFLYYISTTAGKVYTLVTQ